MKKRLAAVLTVVLAVGCCACGGEPSESVPVVSMITASSETSVEDSSEGISAQESQVSPEEPPASSSEESSETTSVEESSEESAKESSASESSVKKESKTASSKAEPPKDITSVELNETSISVKMGETFQLKPTLKPDNAQRQDYTWEWSDSSVISVDASGLVTARYPGKATITLRTYNDKTATCSVMVPEPPESERIHVVSSDYSDVIVGPEWFDDVVFVGDSVTVGLSYYAENGELGDAAFLCSVSLGYYNSMWDLNQAGNVHPVWQGKKVTVEEGIRLSGKGKVFIMLGMNDIGGYGIDGTVNGMINLTDRILETNPDVQIYIQSVTPLISGMRRADLLNNYNVAGFNERAKEVCHERGFVFVSVAEAVSDPYGNLIYDYCGDPGDMGLHFNFLGCSKWVEYLKGHVA